MNYKHLIKIFFCVLSLSSFSFLRAQGDSANAETEKPELITPLAEFSSIQKGDGSIDLKAVLKAKVNGSLIKLGGLKVEFYSTSNEETKLGEVVTDNAGIAIFNCKPNSIPLDTAGKMNFKMSYAGNDKYESAEEEVSVKKGRLEITPVKGDSLNAIQVKLIDLSTGTETPVTETVVSLYVKRLFNPLKIGEGTTDEAGEASIDISKDIPGDSKGNLYFIARLDENETYGMVEATLTQNWGIPVADNPKEMPRALWSASPPLWMLITFIVLMAAVWGHYVVIVWELIRLRKEPV